MHEISDNAKKLISEFEKRLESLSKEERELVARDMLARVNELNKKASSILDSFRSKGIKIPDAGTPGGHVHEDEITDFI